MECCVQIVHDHFTSTKTLMSAGELIREIDLLGLKNKQIKNMIDEPVDLVNEIMSHKSYDVESLSAVIIKEIENARVLEVTNKIVDAISRNEEVRAVDVANLYSRITSDVQDLDFEYSKNTLDVDFDELMDSFEDSKDQGNVIPTGFPILDSHQLGLTRNGEVGIIVAPPNRGKTAFMVALSRNMIMMGYNVLVITGETHLEDLDKRLWAGLLKSSINSLGSADRELARKSFIGARRIGGSLQYHDFIGKDFKPSDLDFIVGKYHEQPGRPIDIIVLDYFDLMLPEKSVDKDNLRVQINKIYKAVRGISVKYGIPIWTASQTNREGSDTILITDKNIGEDWQKICNADKIISFNQTMYEVDNKVARLFVMKTRNSTGKNMVVQIKTNFEQMRFSEIKELSYKEHMKLMITLEHENRRNNSDDKKFKKRTNRLG